MGSEKPTYQGRESRLAEVGEPDSNNTYYNNTDLSDNERNDTNPINLSGRQKKNHPDQVDVMDGEKEYIDEIVELIVEVISVKREVFVIAGAEYPYQFVKNKLLKVNSSHIQYVLECLHDNTTKIRNVKSYLLTCIFNAPSTINNYYRAEVNHDMYGGGNL